MGDYVPDQRHEAIIEPPSLTGRISGIPHAQAVVAVSMRRTGGTVYPNTGMLRISRSEHDFQASSSIVRHFDFKM